MVRDGAGERRLATEVLAYFVRHPEAMDNLEGVARWRLLNVRVQSAVESTQQALEWLVAEGYLLRIDAISGPFFQINPEKLTAAEELLRREPSST